MGGSKKSAQENLQSNASEIIRAKLKSNVGSSIEDETYPPVADNPGST